MKLLVLAGRPVTAATLRAALGGSVDAGDTEVLVLAPALAESPLKFWLADVDEAIARANEVRSQSVRALSDEGISAVGRTGDADPLQAIADALVTFPAERILLFTGSGADGDRYGEDFDETELSERFGLPIDRAPVA